MKMNLLLLSTIIFCNICAMEQEPDKAGTQVKAGDNSSHQRFNMMLGYNRWNVEKGLPETTFSLKEKPSLVPKLWGKDEDVLWTIFEMLNPDNINQEELEKEQ